MTEAKIYSSILIVDDNSCNLDLVCRILAKTDLKILTAQDGLDAINQVELESPTLILLDGMMPKLDGFETCRLLKDNPVTRNIPIIFMTAMNEIERKVQAFALGASDYITKPFQKAELLVRVEHQLESINLRRVLESQNHQLQSEIGHRFKTEVALLESNEKLVDANQALMAEIENRRAIEIQLQSEILERRNAETKVRQSLKEKELLLKEIHHRVKNNLFIVSSLLETQADYTDSPQILKMLNDSQNRIMSMALIHEQLHVRVGVCQIDFQQYLTNLTDYLTESFLTSAITFKANIQQVSLNLETANPCGLIVNELISNAVEHAFVGRERGNILLDFRQRNDQWFVLTIKDDGVGFPDAKDFFHSESLGLELVATLVEQLDGTIEMKSDRGTAIKIMFRELNYESRI